MATPHHRQLQYQCHHTPLHPSITHFEAGDYRHARPRETTLTRPTPIYYGDAWAPFFLYGITEPRAIADNAHGSRQHRRLYTSGAAVGPRLFLPRRLHLASALH
jgi:hypothetical protein